MKKNQKIKNTQKKVKNNGLFCFKILQTQTTDDLVSGIVKQASNDSSRTDTTLDRLIHSQAVIWRF